VDQDLRNLERDFQANPSDNNLATRLVLARRRAGVKPTNVADILLEFGYFQAEAERSRQQMLDASEDIFNSFTEAVFKENPNLHAVVIQGYTPAFNDGDLCLHSQDVMVSTEQFEWHGYESGDEKSNENGDEELDNDED
jgi:hypothetical protein